MLRVQNIENENGRKVVNQFELNDYTNGIKIFQSYDSTILTCDTEHCFITVGEDFGYSRTTNKYTKLFCRQNFVDGEDLYETIKAHKDSWYMWKIIYTAV